MHNFFAGLTGFFMSIGAMFHGGAATTPPHTNTSVIHYSANSASPSAMMHLRFGHSRGQLPQGERPFFGTVTSVSSSTITVQSQMMRPGMQWHNASVTPSITPPAQQSLTVIVDSNTTYQGGSQSSITTGTKIVGVGKINTDGTITALQIRLNPTMSTGFPRRMQNDNN